MALNWISSRTVSALPLIGIGLALANWNAKPAAAWAWAAAIVVFVVMVAVQRRFQLALSRSPGDAASVRSVASVAGAVVFGALMMIIPLALTLAHAYGLVDDPDSGMQRTDHDHGRCVLGRDRQRHAQDAPADIVNAGRRRPYRRFSGMLVGHGCSAALDTPWRGWRCRSTRRGLCRWRCVLRP